MMDGRIVLEGGVELVERLEREGYDQIRQEVGATRWRGAAAQTASERDARRGEREGRAATARRRSTSALAGRGRGGDGRSWRSSASAARAAYERLELPVWRRSGFWTTSLQSLDLEALGARRRRAGAGGGAVPDVVARRSPSAPRAGRFVQSARRGRASSSTRRSPSAA